MRWWIPLVLMAATGTIVGMAHPDAGSISDLTPSSDEYLFTFTVTGQVRGIDMVVDGDGYTYVTGETEAADFPTTEGAYDRTCGTEGQCNLTGAGKTRSTRKDAFVTKIAPDGTLVYSTYFGGLGHDSGRGIAVDALGRAYIIVDSDAVVGSGGLPVSTEIGRGCGQPPDRSGSYGVRRDVVVVRFNAQGSALDYATCIGGTGDDFAEAIAVDDAGFVSVTGRTDSADFPRVNAVQPVLRAGYDIFVAKVDDGGKRLVFSTYLGGSGYEVGDGLAVDHERNVYLLGYSTSKDFPLVLPLQKENRGGGDIVLVKLDAPGRILLYSTYLGTEESDLASSIAADRSGNVVAAGSTASKTFPVTEGVVGGRCTLNPRFVNSCSRDAFLFGVDPLGRLRYSTYLGGTDTDEALDVAVDEEGRAVIAGRTRSTDFPGVNPWIRSPADYAFGFVARLAHAASALTGAQLVQPGAPYGSHSESVGVDRRGNVYVMGAGSASWFVQKIANQPR